LDFAYELTWLLGAGIVMGKREVMSSEAFERITIVSVTGLADASGAALSLA